MEITKQIQDFVGKEGSCFYSDIARKFSISNYTAKDLVSILVKEGKLEVIDKGIAKLVMPQKKEVRL